MKRLTFLEPDDPITFTPKEPYVIPKWYDEFVDAAGKGQYEDIVEAISAALALLDGYTIMEIRDSIDNEVALRREHLGREGDELL